MPSPDEILEQVADVTALVLGIPADQVVGTARFAELGTDSLTIVEIGEEIGRRFDKRLTDEQIDHLDTVQSAVVAVRDAPSAPAAAPAAAAIIPPVAAPEPELPTRSEPDRVTTTAPQPAVPSNSAPEVIEPSHDVERNLSAEDLALLPLGGESGHRARGFLFWFVVTGVFVGGLLGFGLSAMVSATGLGDVALPPLPTASRSPTPTEETTTTPEPEETEAPTPDPTLTTETDQVAPGQRFVLEGAFPQLGDGAELQVQVREPGTGWDDFPITTRTRDGGRFKTELYTSRTGEREFRMLDESTGDTTPTVKVTIG